MKRIILYAILAGLLVAVLQIGLIPTWRLGFVQPNLVIAFITIAVLLHMDQKLIVYATIPCGFLLDAYSSTRFGFITVLLILFIFLLTFMQQRFIHYAAPTSVIATAGISAFLFDSSVALSKNVWFSLGPLYFIENAFYTAVLSAIILGGVFMVNRRLLRNDVLYVRKQS